MNRDTHGVAAFGFHPFGQNGSAFLGRLTTSIIRSDWMVLVALAALWALTHPFVGTIDDARIYMGRALADLYPDSVGRDLMFVMDGQSRFTMFGLLARTSVVHLGLGGTVVALTLLNLTAWFTGIVVFARTIAPGRAAMVVLAAAIVLPRLYTPWNLLSAGESIPEPRPLAEACVLLAMAALLSGRIGLCLTGLVIAALFHPIMAAPGFGVLFVILALRDRRWIAVGLVVGLAVLGASLLGLPLASRLTATTDAVWRMILTDRTPYLFITHWPIETIEPIVVRVVTLAFACVWLGPTARRLVFASCGVALVGVAISAALGDGLSDTLVLQAQLWRAIWLPTVLSNVAAGYCLLHLPRRGPGGQIALCFLALAWVAIDTSPIGSMAALIAVVSFATVPRLSFTVTRTMVIVVGAGCAIIAAALLWNSARAVSIIATSMPSPAVTWGAICALHMLVCPVLLTVMIWWRKPTSPLTRCGVAFAVVAEGILLTTQWDARPAAQADVDAAIIKMDLAADLAKRPGPVLWTDGDEAWTWLHRANWNGQIQGSSIVFSRDLALEWRARSESVVQAGLATASLLRPLIEPLPPGLLPLDATRIARFCSQPGRPTWIVAPLGGDKPPSELRATIWTPPFARGRRTVDGAKLRWLSFDHYAIIPCADPRRG